MSEDNEQELLHYTAYLCEHCKAQFLGQGSHAARYCNNCGALLSAASKQVNAPEAGDLKKVLIIEDSLVLRMAVAKFVTDLGHEIVEAADGREGLIAAQEERPDLIISDINMPNMDGMEFVDRLRESETLKDTPVIMLTSQKNMDIIREAMKKGVIDYILKDMANPSEFKSRLKKYL